MAVLATSTPAAALEHQNVGGGACDACPLHRRWQWVLNRLQGRSSSAPRGLRWTSSSASELSLGPKQLRRQLPSCRCRRRSCWSRFLTHASLLPYQFCTSLFLLRWILITDLPKQMLTNGFKKHCNCNAL
jgi:hypothetical protein